jgi:outer membrane protein OmpA-like peptidoglycan-associated protein
VKQYLVDVMAINPAQIETHGYGATRFLVAPRSTAAPNSPEEQIEIERQRPNRRVVIVVHTDAR